MLTEIEVGKQIRKIRNQCNLDQKSFSKIIGTTVSSLSNWENGRNYPKSKFIDEIAKIGHISSEQLLYGSPTNYLFQHLKMDNIKFDLTNLSNTGKYYICHVLYDKYKAQTSNTEDYIEILNFANTHLLDTIENMLNLAKKSFDQLTEIDEGDILNHIIGIKAIDKYIEGEPIENGDLINDYNFFALYNHDEFINEILEEKNSSKKTNREIDPLNSIFRDFLFLNYSLINKQHTTYSTDRILEQLVQKRDSYFTNYENDQLENHIIKDLKFGDYIIKDLSDDIDKLVEKYSHLDRKED